MIPLDYITEWRRFAPWTDENHVEQDMIITRVLIELFNHPLVARSLAFRGGTALYKLFIRPALRYSEDIDLVQVNAEPIGTLLEMLREIVNPLLGKPKWKLNQGRATLFYQL
jgi:predicted nucleotidyltransferase component of viral defense system